MQRSSVCCYNAIGFSSVATGQIDLDSITAPSMVAQKDENNNVKSLRGWEVSEQRQTCVSAPLPREAYVESFSNSSLKLTG